MLKSLRPIRWVILFLIIFVFSSLVAGYTQEQIRQDQAAFPPPTTDIALADDKTYGVTVDLTRYSLEELHATLDAIQSARLTWIRQPFHWDKIEREPGTFDWQVYDHAIEAAVLRGFKIIAVLDTSPPWARPEGTSPQTPPLEAADFGRFARAVALRYNKPTANQILYYQIWHEPNLSQQWGNRHVDAVQYVRLLKNAAINIRGIQPQAKIIAAALAPTTETGPVNINEMAYLEAMYRAKAAPWFDILAGQLYGFHLPVTSITLNPEVLSIHRVQLLRAIMLAHGDSHKPIWATAFGWHALPADWAGQPPTWPSDSPAKQLTRTIEAIDYARANWSWLGPMLAIRWDGVGLDARDPARGFAIEPDLAPAFTAAAKNKPGVAGPGNYPASHPSGQYSSGWQVTNETADAPRPDEPMTLPKLMISFEGTRLDLNLNRGLFRGYLWVTIDGQPSRVLPKDRLGRSYVVLYDPLREADTVTIARYLTDEAHVAAIEVDGSWGEWAIAGWRVHREANTESQQQRLAIALVAAILSGGGVIWAIGRQRWIIWSTGLQLWDGLQGRYDRLGVGVQIALTAGLILVFYFAPGPLALLMLGLIGLSFVLRPELGLMALSFGISFFLARKSLPVGTFSILELGLIVLTLAAGLKVLLYVGRNITTLYLSVLSNIRVRPTDWATLALLALATVATFMASNFGVAMFELRTLVIGSVVFYFLMRLIPWLEQVDRQTIALRLVDAFVAGAVFHASMALYQYFMAPAQTINAEGVRRALGYLYGSPNNLSLFLDRAFPLLLALTLFSTGRSRRGVYAVGLLIVSGALFLTFSKGALLVAVPAVIIFVALVRGGKTAWLGMGSSLIMLGVALIPFSRTERFQSTFSLQPGSTAFFRLKVWESAWHMLKDFPLTGVGLDNFLYQYRTRYILPEAWQEPNLSHPHNLFLDFGTRLGLGGIVLLLWLLGQFWYRAIKTYRQLGPANTKALLLGLMGSMLAFISHGLIDNSYFLVDLAYTFFFSIGLVEILNDD